MFGLRNKKIKLPLRTLNLSSGNIMSKSHNKFDWIQYSGLDGLTDKQTEVIKISQTLLKKVGIIIKQFFLVSNFDCYTKAYILVFIECSC